MANIRPNLALERDWEKVLEVGGGGGGATLEKLIQNVVDEALEVKEKINRIF